MVDFEVATGAIFTGGVSHCCPTVQESVVKHQLNAYSVDNDTTMSELRYIM